MNDTNRPIPAAAAYYKCLPCAQEIGWKLRHDIVTSPVMGRCPNCGYITNLYGIDFYRQPPKKISAKDLFNK